MRLVRPILTIALLLAGAAILIRMVLDHSNLGALEYIVSGILIVLLVAAAGVRARRTVQHR
jgi:hypothetical protein